MARYAMLPPQAVTTHVVSPEAAITRGCEVNKDEHEEFLNSDGLPERQVGKSCHKAIFVFSEASTECSRWRSLATHIRESSNQQIKIR